MQVTETLNEGLKRGYTITVTAAELDAKVQEKLLEAQPEVPEGGVQPVEAGQAVAVRLVHVHVVPRRGG